MVDPIDDPASDIPEAKPTRRDAKQTLDDCAFVLRKGLDHSNSLEEVKIIEDVYDMNVSEAFEKFNAIALGIPGLRLDLFYPDERALDAKNIDESEDSNGILEEEAKEDLD